jgi:hypothetical protein
LTPWTRRSLLASRGVMVDPTAMGETTLAEDVVPA